MAHDLGHFHILELLYTGEEETDLQKLVYITYRMISEAATMMIADVLFAESLKRSNVEYEYYQRKIHPLYSESNLDIDRDGVVFVLKKLIKANVEFCCKGNEEEWKNLLGDNFEKVFKPFKEKFAPFFIEDYRWNVENYENMSKRKKTMKIWWNDVKTMRYLTSDVPMSFQLAVKAVVACAIFPIAATDNPSIYKSGFPTTPISIKSVPVPLNAT